MIVPVRATVEPLAATEIIGVAPSTPDVGLIVNHVTFEDAVHVGWFVLTVTVVADAACPGVHVVGLTLITGAAS